MGRAVAGVFVGAVVSRGVVRSKLDAAKLCLSKDSTEPHVGIVVLAQAITRTSNTVDQKLDISKLKTLISLYTCSYHPVTRSRRLLK